MKVITDSDELMAVELSPRDKVFNTDPRADVGRIGKWAKSHARSHHWRFFEHECIIRTSDDVDMGMCERSRRIARRIVDGNCKTLIAFDRDGTTETGHPPGPVPIAAIADLKDKGFNLWAIGNQRLCEETGLPGWKTLIERSGANRHAHYLGDRVQFLDRIGVLKLLEQLFPDHKRIVVDDFDLSMVAGWTWLTPDGFMARYDAGDL